MLHFRIMLHLLGLSSHSGSVYHLEKDKMALKSGFNLRINTIASPKTEFKIDLKDQTRMV